ncbi:MAG: DegT/DnrJ/EryC1/StrS family aminotransferase [Phycisphaerae bacterium]|nr:DegT/DnrJ/EryC1/StrS family aminotransferase [Phycisphaerae bacterium]
MKVLYLDLPKQFQDKAFLAIMERQFDRCQFMMGPEVEQFEDNFASICGTACAVGVSSGTDAIFLALKAVDIGSGDEVITVPNSFVATVGAIVAAGAKPVFVDVAEDYNIDVEKIEPAVTARTKAILPVHLTGNPADMPTIMDIADRHRLQVIEDASQAVGATINGRAAGSFGDAGAFSLHPLKNLNVCGDGGVIATSSSELCRKLKLLRNHGLQNRDEIAFFGYNCRLDTVQAAIANYVMKSLPEVINRRQGNAGLYDELLADLGDSLTLPPRSRNVCQVFHTYVITVRERQALISHLAARGVETKVHYPVPIHLQKPCLEMGYKRGDFPVTERQAESVISLPIHQHLTEEQIRYTCGVIHEFYEGAEV